MNDPTIHVPFDNLGGDLNGVSELMCRPRTAIGILIIDASESMRVHGPAPAEAVDNAVAALQKDQSGVTYYLGIVSFANRMQVLQRIAPVHAITPLAGYRAAGNTRLFGTVSDVLTFLLGQVMMAGDRIATDLSVAVGVFSDGNDNLSPESLPLLHETAKAVRSRGWSLQTFGIGIDSKSLARTLGFDPDMAITVRATAQGLDDATSTFMNTMTTRLTRIDDPSTTDEGIRSDP